MNLISETEKDIDSITYSINDLAISTTIEELNGRETIIEDNKKDFDLQLDELVKDTKELSRLKAILYEKNNSFKLSDGRTIQEAIVDNTNLRKLKDTYEKLLLLKSSKNRVTEVNNSYFESHTLNFNPDDIRKKLDDLDKKIQETDFEISKLNSIEFEI